MQYLFRLTDGYQGLNLRHGITEEAMGEKEQIRLFCCALWVIWGSRNQMIHERKFTSRRDLSHKIQSYLMELEGVTQGQDRETIRETIQFDAAFDTSNFRSASEIVDRDQNGVIKVSKSTLHSNVSCPFLGINMGLDSVTIIGDSKTVINKCQTTVRDKSIIGVIIKDIQSNKSRFHEIVFMFIQRTDNLQAHNLAKDTLKKGEEMYLVRETLNETAPEVRWPQNPN
ncbi:hypothetical protein ES332_D01G245700v1 [Gossypium tomentosum]|uniref:RNase H type-1 domain-containing protein n=1 Tax=Gossypium tomentosum TaxID=34277 RepID=A0A5D2MCQ7_GOSTO|nr:hypothetical protein ES332_D01G245700v1 [Gossypium tomentosum]